MEEVKGFNRPINQLKEVVKMAMAVKECVLDNIKVQELDRLYRETGIAVLCEDGHAVNFFKEEE